MRLKYEPSSEPIHISADQGLGTTFFRPETPLALARRVLDGTTGDLGSALSRWQVSYISL